MTFRILLLEDNEIDIRVKKKILDEYDPALILVVKNGQEALAKGGDAIANGEIEFIVADIRMTGMNGIEFGIIAKQLNPKVCLIYHSNDKPLNDVEHDGYIPKSLHTCLARKKLNELLAHRNFIHLKKRRNSIATVNEIKGKKIESAKTEMSKSKSGPAATLPTLPTVPEDKELVIEDKTAISDIGFFAKSEKEAANLEEKPHPLSKNSPKTR